MDQKMDDDKPTTARSGCNIICLSLLLLGVLTAIPKSGDLILAFVRMGLSIVVVALFIYGCGKGLVGMIRGR